MAILFLTLTVFLVVVLAMAVGIIFRRPCLRGSCGGPEVLDASGEPLTCATCPNRKKKERAVAGDGEGLPVLR
ncbi:MAG: Na(+)-translocating NADH-quinone reductase subunit E [Thermoanaerobaculia bacterium]|nr:Na(+)-translocating NADH-quinone reductase subunit E [Thermoanaerobaculia bacterium]